MKALLISSFLTLVSIIGMPMFSGRSYLELPKLEAYSRFSVEMEIRTLSTDGILLYNGQTSSGKGDYVSLAIKSGFVEFRYSYISKYFSLVFLTGKV